MAKRLIPALSAFALALAGSGLAFQSPALAAPANPGGAAAGSTSDGGTAPLAGGTSGDGATATPVSTQAAGGTSPTSKRPGRAKDAGSFQLGERILRRGSRGADVAQLQRLLAQLRLHTPPSGIFDGRTQRAVRRFQRARALRVTGVVGADTVASLTAIVPPPSAGAQVASDVPVHLDWVFPIQPLSLVVAPTDGPPTRASTSRPSAAPVAAAPPRSPSTTARSSPRGSAASARRPRYCGSRADR
jgi:peptidoglycan hydrolase-like protein with peptidoglycan-binding domain